MQHDTKLIPMREFRAHMPLALDAPFPAVIGSRWRLRALVIPIPPHYPYDRAKRRAARAETKRRFATALKLAFDQQ